MAEVSATAGFDWLLIDGEHSPNDLNKHAGRAGRPSRLPSHPIVRVVEGSEAPHQPGARHGAQTILVPMVDTAAQAAHVVAATRYPPQGVRGVGSAIARASRWNTPARDYLGRGRR